MASVIARPTSSAQFRRQWRQSPDSTLPWHTIESQVLAPQESSLRIVVRSGKFGALGDAHGSRGLSFRSPSRRPLVFVLSILLGLGQRADA
jgi:hypothetical protein